MLVRMVLAIWKDALLPSLLLPWAGKHINHRWTIMWQESDHKQTNDQTNDERDMKTQAKQRSNADLLKFQAHAHGSY